VAASAGAAAIRAAAGAARWGSRQAWRDPLLWVLHVGYAFVPIGLALRATAALTAVVPASMATHALTVGAIGMLTIGMMARVSLGHTGRPLRATPIVAIAFALLGLAAVVRVIGALLGPAGYLPSLHLAGTAWTVAFALFLWRYAPVLLRARVDGKPG
jgi:uncharacterized protein involved in response to NO